jgi:hypothetical protein
MPPTAHKHGDKSSDPFSHRFQKVKAEIHRKLVEMLDLSRLTQWRPERLRREVRALAISLSETPDHLLS